MKKLLLLTLLLSCGKKTQTQTLTETVTQPAGIPQNVTCQVYDMSGQYYANIPDFDTLNLLGTVKVDQFDSLSTDNTVSFPKFVGTSLEDIRENFGMKCTGRIQITEAGVHTFKLSSDDGSRLFINGVRIVNNDGQHAMKAVTGNVNLSVGLHTFKVEFFNGGGNKGLVLSYKRPGQLFEEIVPRDRLK